MSPGETAPHKVQHWKWKQVIIAIAIAMIVWLLDFSNVIPEMNDIGYDACLQLASASTASAHVLLVYVDRKHLTQGPDAAESLSRVLLGLGAIKIGFTCPLSQPSEGLLKLSHETGNIVLAREFRANPANPNEFEWSPTSEATKELPSGLVGLSPESDGVYRSHFGGQLVDGSWQASLEVIIARKMLLNHQTIPDGDYRVAFLGGTGSLPHVDYESVVGGDLVRALVEDKVVLVGLKPDPAFPGITTPTTRGKVKMSLLEFHGHALQTLLVAGPIHVLPPIGRFILFVVSALICHFLFQAIRFKWGLLLALPGFLLDAAVALALLSWQSLWIPFAPVGLVQMLCFVEVYQKKFQFCEQAVGGVLLDQSIKLRRRRIPTGFFATDDPWSQLTSLIYQQFYLNRMIVMERCSDSDYLQEVHAVNCGLEDVAEKRRDCRRWPYSEVVESKLPLRVDIDGRSFLAGRDPGEHQYLVKLAFDGDVLGFLVLGVAAECLETCPDFRLRLQSAANEIAALLHRWRVVRSQRGGPQSWRGRLTSIPEEEPFRQLGRANHLLENRMARLEKTLDSSDTACAIYDLFGQLQFMNGRLAQLLREKGIVPGETSALDLLCSLAGRDLNSGRNLLQQIIGDKRSSSLKITLENPARVFQLNIRPLQLDTAPATGLPEEAEPFQLNGIYIELVDGSPFVEMHDVTDRITDRLCHDLSKNLDNVHRLVTQLAHDEELPERYQQVSDSVEKNLIRAVTVLQECQGFISSDLINEPGESVPIDGSAALRRAVEAIERTHNHDLDVRLLLPDVAVGDVLANPQLLQPMFTALLELLLSDASGDPVISVRAEEGIGDISFVLEAAHAGASVDALRKVLVDDAETRIVEFRQLREVRDWVDQWGGRMVVSTKDKTGIAIKLVLKRHHWMSDPPPTGSPQTRNSGKKK